MKNALVVCLAVGLVLSLGGLVVAADDEAKEMKGDAGCMKCCFKTGDDCAASVKMGDTVYALKSSDKASDETKKLIDSFKAMKADDKAVAVVIKGVIKDKAVIADEVKKVVKAAEKSVGLNMSGAVAMADDAAKEIKGDAGCMKCCFKTGDDCAAAVKVGDATYALKAGEKASDDAKKLIDSFKGAKETIAVVITGTIKDKAIIVDDIKKVEKKKAE
jgi:VCBS repeat-containing protein